MHPSARTLFRDLLQSVLFLCKSNYYPTAINNTQTIIFKIMPTFYDMLNVERRLVHDFCGGTTAILNQKVMFLITLVENPIFPYLSLHCKFVLNSLQQ